LPSGLGLTSQPETWHHNRQEKNLTGIVLFCLDV